MSKIPQLPATWSDGRIPPDVRGQLEPVVHQFILDITQAGERDDDPSLREAIRGLGEMVGRLQSPVIQAVAWRLVAQATGLTSASLFQLYQDYRAGTAVTEVRRPSVAEVSVAVARLQIGQIFQNDGLVTTESDSRLAGLPDLEGQSSEEEVEEQAAPLLPNPPQPFRLPPPLRDSFRPIRPVTPRSAPGVPRPPRMPTPQLPVAPIDAAEARYAYEDIREVKKRQAQRATPPAAVEPARPAAISGQAAIPVRPVVPRPHAPVARPAASSPPAAASARPVVQQAGAAPKRARVNVATASLPARRGRAEPTRRVVGRIVPSSWPLYDDGPQRKNFEGQNAYERRVNVSFAQGFYIPSRGEIHSAIHRGFNAAHVEVRNFCARFGIKSREDVPREPVNLVLGLPQRRPRER